MGTYTTNYNLYKPAVGEQGWGSNVNSNFDKIDQMNGFKIPPNANLTKSDKDSNGVYLTYTWELATAITGQPAKWTSVLSSEYTSRVFTVYGSDKTTVLATYTFTRTLDSDANLVSEVLA